MVQFSKTRLTLTIGGAIVVWISLWWLGLRSLSIPNIAAWSGILYALCCLPTILFLAGHRVRIPIMPMWGIGYFMMFGVPLLSPEGRFSILDIPDASVIAAIRFAVYGALACLVTFYTPLGKWVEALVPKFKASWDSRRAPTFGVGLWGLGFFIQYVTLTLDIPSTLRQFLNISAQLAIVGMLVLFLLQLRRQLPIGLRLFLWGIILPIELLISLGTGAIWQVIVVLTPLLFLFAAERGQIPWRMMALIAIVLIPFLGIKHEYRSYAWYGEAGEFNFQSSSPAQRGYAFSQLVVQRLQSGGMETYTLAMEDSGGRVSHLGVFAEIIDSTPSSIPFWEGESYRSLFWSLIPRILYPEKPTKTIGQAFGHRYGFLHEEDYRTSFNLPHQAIEMYANFGLPGILIGMAIIGLVYRVLGTWFGSSIGERGTIIGCALLANLLSLDADFSLVFGSLLYYILIMVAAFKFLPESKDRPSPLELEKEGA